MILNNGDKQVLNPAADQPQPIYEDEINLVDIVSILLRRKNIIIGITIISVFIGLAYAFTTERVYQVETILFPPSFENIQSLNVLNSGNVNSSNVNSSNVNSSNINSSNINSSNVNSSNLNSINVFASFTSNINSRKFRKEFFDKFNMIEMFLKDSSQVLNTQNANNLFEGFSKSLNVTADKKTNSIRITLEGIHKEKIGRWLDDFVVMANQKTINQLIKDLQANIDSKIKSLNINISSKRSIYKKRREDQLGRLQEAFQIAKSLGVHEYSFNKSLSSINNLSVYMKGTKVLLAEINALKNRASDDIYITGLRDLQEQLARFEAIKIEANELQTVIVDKEATVNIEPIRPKRRLIVMLSLVLGGMFGIFTVFIMEFINKLKKQANSVDTV